MTGVVDRPIAEVLRELDPSVTVVPAREPSSSTHLLGWTMPGSATAGLALALLFATVLLIVFAGEARRATQWAWAWLVLMLPPIGPLCYLSLSGVLSRREDVDAAPGRLTGGWAFVLALIGASVLGSGTG